MSCGLLGALRRSLAGPSPRAIASVCLGSASSRYSHRSTLQREAGAEVGDRVAVLLAPMPQLRLPSGTGRGAGGRSRRRQCPSRAAAAGAPEAGARVLAALQPQAERPCARQAVVLQAALAPLHQ